MHLFNVVIYLFCISIVYQSGVYVLNDQAYGVISDMYENLLDQLLSWSCGGIQS